MKKKSLLLSISAVFAAILASSYDNGPALNGVNRTGSNNTSASCDGSGCHAANNTALNVTVVITDTGSTTPITSYVPGKKYRLRVAGATTTLSQSKFGFQVSTVKASSTSTQAGTIAAGGTSTANTAVRTVGGLQIGEHTMPLSGTGTGTTWAYTANLYWTAPAAGTGQVKLYTTINAVNGSGVGGDAPNAASSLIGESTSVPTIGSTVSFSAYPNPATSFITINADGISSGNWNVAVYDLRGKVIATQSITSSNSNFNTNIDCSKWAAGMYYVQIGNETETKVMPIVKR